MKEELEQLVGQKIPIKTMSGTRLMDYIYQVRNEVVVLATHADGSGRQTVLALAQIESFTSGGPDEAAAGSSTLKPWERE